MLPEQIVRELDEVSAAWDGFMERRDKLMKDRLDGKPIDLKEVEYLKKRSRQRFAQMEMLTPTVAAIQKACT
jgi:uncharacterized protein YydD (DUF2326 family)